MIYSLDTNTCIRFITGRSPEILKKLPTISPQDIVVCSVVRAELFYGASKSQTPLATLAKQERFLRPYQSIALGDAEAKVYGDAERTAAMGLLGDPPQEILSELRDVMRQALSQVPH